VTTNEDLQRIGFLPFDTVRSAFNHQYEVSKMNAITAWQGVERTQNWQFISNIKPQTALNLGRAIISLAIFCMLAAIAIAYFYDAYFSISEQTCAHLTVLISAAFFKLGYVVRLAAHHALGNYSAG
jgi:hypothetical protein